MAKMSDLELREKLKKNGWTLPEACEIIYLRTGSILKAKNIRNLLDKEGQLSNTLTALFRMLFLHYGVDSDRKN